MFDEVLFVNEERITLLPVEVLVNQSEQVVAVVVKTAEGANLVDSYKEDAGFEVFSAHILSNSACAWVFVGSPSVHHVVEALFLVFASHAHNGNWVIE